MRRAAALAFAFLALPSCGLQPMYAGGGKGAVARGLTQVDVPPIEGKDGWLMRRTSFSRQCANFQTCRVQGCSWQESPPRGETTRLPSKL